MDGTDSSNGQTSLDDGAVRRCRFCRRELSEGFVFCPFCGGRISPGDRSQVRWYRSRYAAILGLATLPPLALPYIWSNPRYSVTTKTVFTVLILALTALLVFLICLVVVVSIRLVQQIRQLTIPY